MRAKSVTRLIALVFAFNFLALCVQADDGPKFKNPNPTFKPLSAAQEQAVLDRVMAKQPPLSKEQWKELREGEILVQEMPTEGEARRFQSIGLIAAPPKAIMKLMKRFETHVGVMPHLEKVKATWKNKNLAVVEQDLKIALSHYRYKINVYHFGDRYIEWEYVEGDLKETNGYYKFFPIDDGNTTLVVYHVFTDPGIPIPDFILNMVTKSSMPKVLRAIRENVPSPEKSDVKTAD